MKDAKISLNDMSQTPSSRDTGEPGRSTRIFLDASILAAFKGHAPNKFTRLVEALTRGMPGSVVGTMTSDGFLQQDIANFDTTPSYKGLLFGDSRFDKSGDGSKVSLWRRTELNIILALLRLSLPKATKSYLRNAGAYKLAAFYRPMSNPERLRLYEAFEVNDPEREASFSWWLKDDVEASLDRPYFREARTLIEVGEDDVVVFAGLAGGIAAPKFLTRSKARKRYKIACILLDISPILSPGITDRQYVQSAKEALRTFAELSDLLVVPSELAANRLTPILEGLTTPRPVIAIVPTFLGLSPTGMRSKVSALGAVARPFALAITSFKRRKNAYWILSAWKRAAEISGEQHPHLVIVSSTADDGHGWLLAEDKSLSEVVTVISRPTDRELRWLLDKAAFVIQPPAQGGLGTAAMEATFFGKRVLCERHAANDHLSENKLVFRLPLDMDSWVSAIVHASETPDVDPEPDYADHARYTRQYVERISACLAGLATPYDLKI